ncbi:hypothetical protein [Acinetobacter sp. LoGeW2-3]|uniref:hypothetical protein n=1 Tax=Acinetobacter sp. LoGeW2-3 TaxID=1808001 RepID=UPI00148ADB59|nr:hypothetical protein [Acinetobacter sp. LoGeW2-3]
MKLLTLIGAGMLAGYCYKKVKGKNTLKNNGSYDAQQDLNAPQDPKVQPPAD